MGDTSKFNLDITQGENRVTAQKANPLRANPTSTLPREKDPLQKQLSDIEDQIRQLNEKTDKLQKTSPLNQDQQGRKNHNPTTPVNDHTGASKNQPIRESLDETLDIVDGQKVDLANPEIKYLMDEVHAIQGKMKKLETENQKLKNDLAITSNKRQLGSKEEEYKPEGFDLNKYIGVYQGMDEVIKLDTKLTKFIDFQTNYNKRFEMEID